jgi:hypothetical protein
MDGANVLIATVHIATVSVIVPSVCLFLLKINKKLNEKVVKVECNT